MANVEGQSATGGERVGGIARNLGILVAVFGLVPVLDALLLPGAFLAASGEIFRRVSKKKQ